MSNLAVITRLEIISRVGNKFHAATTSSHYAIEMKLAVPLRIIFLPVRKYPSRVVFPASRPYGATAFGIGSEAAVKPLL